MKSKTILITDTLFFFDEHEQQLRDAGYDIERLKKPDATEDELAKAIKGKVGYLFGGIERVTKKVIDAADELEVISFTGIGYKGFIPAWEYATEKGIAITSTPSGPTNEVAEWALTGALMMNRHFLELGRASKKTTFMVTQGLENQKIGIVGLGRVGSRIAEMVKVFRPAEVNYNSLSRHSEKEAELGINYLELAELLETSDIVFLCVDDSAQNYLDAGRLELMKKDALLVNITHAGVVNDQALLTALEQQKIRAISDYPMKGDGFSKLTLDRWYCMNTSNTITESGSQLMSDMATQSLLNVLQTGDDQYLVNPKSLK